MTTTRHTSESEAGDLHRIAGILLHPTSLPGPYGVGDLGEPLIAFLDWAVSAGLRLWQVLPLNPPGYGNSPYGCLSSFAGNPLLISPQRLHEDGLLPTDALTHAPTFFAENVAFDSVAVWKSALLRTSWRHFRAHGSNELRQAFAQFVDDDAQLDWLDDFALYTALKENGNGAPWWEWERGLVRREPQALEVAREELADDIEFHRFVQFLFARQWSAVRSAAQARGIRIMGDVPIYVARDSADVWSHPTLFELDEHFEPQVVAGVPPDYFSVTGQRWGNPLYRWDRMRESGYAWWVSRIRANLRLADMVRLDHFRGFAAYWEIPASEPTAVHGRWMPGPGKPLFDAIHAALGDLPLIAEDLGFITPEVHELRRVTALPGMKILQFGFAQLDSPHLPHRYDPRTVVYTGTHDNDTARGWYEQASHEERAMAETYLGATGDAIPWALIRAAYTSVAQTAIVPAQDLLALDTHARMNRPGASTDNWSWRLREGALTYAHAERLRRLAEITGRLV